MKKTPGPTQYDFTQLRQVRKEAAVSELICAVGFLAFLLGELSLIIHGSTGSP